MFGLVSVLASALAPIHLSMGWDGFTWRSLGGESLFLKRKNSCDFFFFFFLNPRKGR